MTYEQINEIKSKRNIESMPSLSKRFKIGYNRIYQIWNDKNEPTTQNEDIDFDSFSPPSVSDQITELTDEILLLKIKISDKDKTIEEQKN